MYCQRTFAKLRWCYCRSSDKVGAAGLDIALIFKSKRKAGKCDGRSWNRFPETGGEPTSRWRKVGKRRIYAKLYLENQVMSPCTSNKPRGGLWDFIAAM